MIHGSWCNTCEKMTLHSGAYCIDQNHSMWWPKYDDKQCASKIKIIEYLVSLPEFDLKIFEKITGIRS